MKKEEVKKEPIDLLKNLNPFVCKKRWSNEEDFDKFYKWAKTYKNVKSFTKEEAFVAFKTFTGLNKITLKTK